MESVVFAVNSVHPDALPYYQNFPFEPLPGNNTTKAVKFIGLAENSAEALLNGILKNVPAGGSIIVVSHGNSEGLSMTMGIARSVTLQVNALRILRANMEGRMDDAQTAQTLKMGQFNNPDNPTGLKQLADLKALVAKVQQLELERVDFRSCNTGKSAVTLSQLQVFFNCRTTCAPDIYDTFGMFKSTIITTSASVWKQWRTDHPNAHEGGDQQQFDVDYVLQKGVATLTLSTIASSQEAINSWVGAHLPPRAKDPKGPLLYHGLTDMIRIVFAGEPGYRQHLVEAQKGKEPSYKVSADQPLER